MNKQEIIIRCDGGRKIGLGHVMRCIALADMLRENFIVSFAIQETSDEVKTLLEKEKFDIHVLPSTDDYNEDAIAFLKMIRPDHIVVLDGYNFRSEYQKTIKDHGCKLVCIDDLHAWHHYADIVINHAGGVTSEEYDCEQYTKLLLGFDYVLLRKEILTHKRTIKKPGSLSNFFISMGAADEHGNTIKFAEALLHWEPTEKIRMMVSTLNPHIENLRTLCKTHSRKIELYFNVNAHELIQLIERTDLVICPASTIALETCAIGCMLMTGTTAANQKSNLQGLIKNDMALDLGDLNALTKDAFLIKLESMHLNPENAKMLHQQEEKMRNLSGSLINKALNTLAAKNNSIQLDIRNAQESDLMLYFNWANDPEVRNNSFNITPISLEDHTKWFLANLRSESVVMLLFLVENEPIGQVRFSIDAQTALLNFSIEKHHRGRGLSAPIIQRSVFELQKSHPNIGFIHAEVKHENVASAKAFIKSNFKKINTTGTKIVFQLGLVQ